MEDRIIKVFEWLQTPTGQIAARIIGVFFFAEVARMVTYKIMGLIDLGRKREVIIVDLVGFGANIFFGLLFAFLFKNGNSWGLALMWGSFYMGGALIVHMIYAYKIEPWIKKKAADKKV